VKVLEQLRLAIRSRHYSMKTEKSYMRWVEAFIRHEKQRAGQWRHPEEMAEPEIEAFLNHLSIDRKVSSTTHRQALCAIIFLYRHVVKKEIDQLKLSRPKRAQRMPVVLSVDEVLAVLAGLSGRNYLMAALMYGAGLRQAECLKLRVQDIDFSRQTILVRSGKGDKDRVVPLPRMICDDLKIHLTGVRRRHMRDLQNGFGSVEMPAALARKFKGADRQWIWQYVFPADNLSVDPRSGVRRRHHVYETTIARAVRQVARTAGIKKRVTCHTLRHSYATHLVEAKTDIRTVQQLMGHKHINTTMIYIHTAETAVKTVSPLDNHGLNRLSGIKNQDVDNEKMGPQ